MKSILTKLIFSLVLLMLSIGNAGADSLWNTLKQGNHFVLIRHALAPGYSDPNNFNVKDCKTQRNLNDEGRNQSKKIGELFKKNGITSAAVYSSQWCRCLETARLLNLGNVYQLSALNSFFENFEQRDPQTTLLSQWINTTPLDTPTILVSHQVNISALTGYSPSSGELVFVRREADGNVTIIGTIPTLR